MKSLAIIVALMLCGQASAQPWQDCASRQIVGSEVWGKPSTGEKVWVRSFVCERLWVWLPSLAPTGTVLNCCEIFHGHVPVKSPLWEMRESIESLRAELATTKDSLDRETKNNNRLISALNGLTQPAVNR